MALLCPDQREVLGRRVGDILSRLDRVILGVLPTWHSVILITALLEALVFAPELCTLVLGEMPDQSMAEVPCSCPAPRVCQLRRGSAVGYQEFGSQHHAASS